jgi:hypothetical protein
VSLKSTRKAGDNDSRAKREISRLFKALPILDERRQGIGAAAESIVHTATLARAHLAICDKFDSENEPNLMRGLLKRVDGHAQQLIECIEHLPLNTFDAIRIALRSRPMGEPVFDSSHDKLPLPSRNRLLTDLRQLKEASSRALSRRRSGNRLASEVTNVAALCYTSLTGKAATPGWNPYEEERSEFERLLAGIFEILGIEVSAERQSKNLVKEKRKPRHLARRLLRDN